MHDCIVSKGHARWWFTSKKADKLGVGGFNRPHGTFSQYSGTETLKRHGREAIALPVCPDIPGVDAHRGQWGDTKEEGVDPVMWMRLDLPVKSISCLAFITPADIFDKRNAVWIKWSVNLKHVFLKVIFNLVQTSFKTSVNLFHPSKTTQSTLTWH